MSSIFRSPFVGIVLLLIAVPLLTSCAPDASAAIISPTLGETEITQRAIEEDIRLGLEPTPEPVLVTLSELSEEEITAGLPADIEAALASVNPADGETLALANGCVGCHILEEESNLAGPVWHNLGNRAITRAQVTGNPSPAAYLYESIAAPGAYIVDGYVDGVMPANYTETLSTDDFATLIAYILEQQQGE